MKKLIKASAMKTQVEILWEKMVDYNICTEDELQLVTDMNGYSLETLNSALYCRTGYRSMEQYEEEMI